MRGQEVCVSVCLTEDYDFRVLVKLAGLPLPEIVK